MLNVFSLPSNTSKNGFFHLNNGVGSSIKSNLSATTDPAVSDDSSDGYEIGSIWINVTLDKVFTCVDSSVGAAVWDYLGDANSSYPSNWAKGIGTDLLALSRTDSASVPAIDPMIQCIYNTPISGLEVAPVFYGYFRNTGNSAGGSGHGIGVLGRSDDTVNGQVDLIGVEGRVDAFGSGGGHCSFLGISNWVGTTFAGRQLYGHIQRVEIRDAPDVGAAVNEGTAVSYFAPSIVGGDPANRWTLFGFDPIRTRTAIRCFNSDDSNQIVLAATAFDTYLQSTTKIHLNPAAGDYLILDDCLGFVPITTNRKLGDGSISLNWQLHATELNVLNTKVVGARRTGWTAATGTATRTSFATGSVTLPNLAQAVKALIDDLIAHGLIGT